MSEDKEYGFPKRWKRMMCEGKEFVAQVKGGTLKTPLTTNNVWKILMTRFLINPFKRFPAFNGYGTKQLKPIVIQVRWTDTQFDLTIKGEL